MKSTLIWLLLAGVGAVLLLGDTVDAWNRQFFNRYSRSWLRNNADGPIGGGGVAGLGGSAGNAQQIDDFNALFGLGNDMSLHGNGGSVTTNGGGVGGNRGAGGGVSGGSAGVGYATYGAGYDVDTGGFGGQQQQTEIYGIVEPLIEDTPCVDRACQVNDDCCPTGVCVNTYGEGKCIYVYGRKRDLCHRNTDCELGMSCRKSAAGNLMCQASASTAHLLNAVGGGVGAAGVSVGDGGSLVAGGASNNAVGFNVGANMATAPKLTLNAKQFGEDCISSSDCNVSKGLCCQLQRTHHRIRPRKLCAYFRDPFMCIDIMPADDEEVRDSRFLSAFSQRRM
ncbi:loricrin isoform X1 [Bactrocera tryoni]|uniref:loricrin isoform X1 n=1 Tax=Bactrocera tryoni TaxID=59916 RepID=UPI001A96E44F|nr:loricrin isoform X1 [Bactrocera tryoni]XP_039953511.1 loricrin isoform X1 [Bactrocera tryoni]XP_039953512.1 loricrin isoform X1 [Bactrocera tryoni]XP_039953513.1 loricrin isoform X1 [Bactrocera tryoni]